MLLLGLLVFGLFVGWVAQLLLGARGSAVDWSTALIAGVLGSFLGGLTISLLAGDGLELRPSGLLGSIAGAVVVTALVARMGDRKA